MTGGAPTYNDVLRRYYDALYRQNIEVDFISPASKVDLARYKLVIVPALYSASDGEITRLNAYAKAGGHLLYTFKSGFSDENTKVRAVSQPGLIAEAAGVTYTQFAIPENATLEGDPFAVGEKDNAVTQWMEFLTPTTATVLARYKHPQWPAYAAVTRNRWGAGTVGYVGFMPGDALAEKILREEVRNAGIALPEAHFPVIVRGGTLASGKSLSYVLNYSAEPRKVPVPAGTELLSGKAVGADKTVDLPAWGVAIVEQRR